MTMKSYDPKANNAVFAGIPITGYTDGTYINVVMNNDAFSLKVGAQGEGGRAKTNDGSGRITFTLMQTSICNDQLSAKHNADLIDPIGVAGVGPFMMKDNSGRSVVSCQSAWIVKFPDQGFSKDVEDREWIIESDSLKIHVGGN